MNTTGRIHHLIGILAAAACALLAFAAASPALSQTISVPHYGPPASVIPAQVHTVIAAGMPGLADHPDRARRRLGRSHRGRGPGPRPDRLRDHRMSPAGRPGRHRAAPYKADIAGPCCRSL